jgi:hypothetical protein
VWIAKKATKCTATFFNAKKTAATNRKETALSAETRKNVAHSLQSLAIGKQQYCVHKEEKEEEEKKKKNMRLVLFYFALLCIQQAERKQLPLNAKLCCAKNVRTTSNTLYSA